jgi:hypothetical protein
MKVLAFLTLPFTTVLATKVDLPDLLDRHVLDQASNGKFHALQHRPVVDRMLKQGKMKGKGKSGKKTTASPASTSGKKPIQKPASKDTCTAGTNILVNFYRTTLTDCQENCFKKSFFNVFIRDICEGGQRATACTKDNAVITYYEFENCTGAIEEVRSIRPFQCNASATIYYDEPTYLNWQCL